VRPSDLTAANRVRAHLKTGGARAQRKAAGVSMRNVARVLGVTPQAVHYWETYQNVPTVEHALAYGRLLATLTKKAA
jgi:DNA-binding transcriptional regulator YiaG